MKLKFGALLLMFVFVSASLVMPVAAAENENLQIKPATVSLSTISFFNNGYNRVEWCVVSTDGGNLNVRTYQGRVIGKVANGTSVWVTDWSNGWAKISVRRRGRLVSLGWVAGDYLEC